MLRTLLYSVTVVSAALLLTAAQPGWAAENPPAPTVFSHSLKDLPPNSLSPTELTADEAATSMEFMVALKMRDFSGLQARIAKGEIISPEEMAAKYYPLKSDYQAVVDWLTGQGLTISKTDSCCLGIFVSGSADLVRKSLNTSMAKVSVNGKTYIEGITAPSLPAALAAPVLGINGLQPHIQPHKHIRKAAAQARPDSTTNPYTPAFLPSEILTAYNAKGLGLTGAGQTIGIVIDTFPSTSDLTQFWTEAGVNQSLNNIDLIQVVSGTLSAPSGEETLDTEWTSGIASGAKVRVYAVQNLSFFSIDQGYAAIVNDLASQPSLRQVSCSFGAGEAEVSGNQMSTDEQYFASMAAGGVSVFISTGDNGYNPDGTIQIETPANDPDVTGVGGTSLYMTGAGAVSSETAWSGNYPGDGGGGGISIYFSRPSWQTGSSLPSGTTRLLPDIAAPADPNTGALVVLGGSNDQYGGTSWSAPTWAGFCALINQSRASSGLQPLGLLGPKIYPLMGTLNFRDITTGNNGYSAGAGFDLCTGIGVPNVSALVQTFAGAAWPLQIALNSGAGQSAMAGTAVPTAPSFIVKDASNNLVAGVTVTFAANNAGSVTPASATTNASGVASVTSWTLGGAAGTNTLTATVSSTTISAQVTAVGTPKPPPAITSSPPPGGAVGVSYNFTYAATGAPTFTVSSGSLPGGLSLSSAGVISGTPTAAGTFTGVVTATNGVAPDATQAFSITIVLIPPKITSLPPPGGIAGVLYNFSYVASGAPTFTVSSGSLPAGLTLSSTGVISGTPTTVGTFTGVVTASNGASSNATQAFSITIAGTLAFTSNPSAAPTTAFIGQKVAFNSAAKGYGTLKFAWNFGDGSTASTATATHIYSTPGAYTATLNATDSSTAAISGTVAITVLAPFIGTGPDSDGDGISDSADPLLGITPGKPATSPLADPGAPPLALNIAKMQVRLNFSPHSHNSDAISIAGTLPVPAQAQFNGEEFVVQVGGFTGVLTLNARGQSKSSTAQFAVQFKSKKGVIAAQTGKFILRLGHATFADALAGSGLVNGTVSQAVSVNVALIFNKALYTKSQPMKYTAKAGKSGSAK